jgi:hypothetical protein
MKNLLASFGVILFSLSASAQLKPTTICAGFVVNIMEGNINYLDPDFTSGQIKKALPCYTSEISESDTSACGGLISYRDNDVYFYTGRDYIEIREKFKGKLSIPLMGASRKGLFNWLGYPEIKDINWEAFQTRYGILILHYNKLNKVNLIQMSKKNAQTIKLCE